ncbi:CDP-alcohol phosphatidyltransferase family protein [Tropicimonas sp. IMCC6043]|uniref:CDP-alcohol phosphatidyltransferase family protein n=1 Tax=Tropicimonas sp. IMCC6043 TaxID=2510645 RepID=UPI00101D80FE|nr:CDP-alcohol phosphatidyltransferase family protein [Tropicimonas sp. IMCC6043]RYH05936.1 CDP-alcohol phosphatidyltransferase family protein [Tropicimonas sp. IMCC6043]
MFSIANLLSLYRLTAAPIAAWMALTGNREAFFVLIVISLVSDLLDGPIARYLGQESVFGARLDTIADACTVLAGILGIFLFEGENIRPEMPWLYVFLAGYALAAIVSLAKFRVLPSYHLYSSKTAAVFSGVFFLWLFMFGYSRPFFLFVLGIGVLASIESLMVTLVTERFRSDIGSVFLVLAQTDEARKQRGRDAQ